MSASLFFDIWPSDDVTGDALGELTEAYDKTFRSVANAMGSGQFSINRHDAQAAWCGPDNLVRVRRVAGGPFAYDDDRYIGAFWIEGGTDALVSEDEEGGEDITRGGRTIEACLRWAILYPSAFDPSNDKFTTHALTTGNWTIKDRTGGEVMAIFIRDLNDRSPIPIPFLTRDFTTAEDSSGASWSDTGTDWEIPVGTNGLDLLGTLVSGGMFYRMGADAKMHAYEDDPGDDLSGSITVEKGVDLAEAAEREIHAREAVSHALVKGTAKSGKLQFREVADSGVQSAIGRREGFVEFERTSTNAKLDRAGARYIAKMKRRHDGPTSAGVVEHSGSVAFDDYVAGDTIALTIPGEFSAAPVKVYAIQLDERPGGDADVMLEFEESPFDPGTGPDAQEFGDGQAPGRTCGDCPPLPPYVNPGPTDIYPACGDTFWPYAGTASGLTDKIGRADGAPVATNGWDCFVTGTTYHYEITGSGGGNLSAWSFGLAGYDGDASSAPNIFAFGPFGSFPTPSIHETGTFVAGAGLPSTVYFYASAAEHDHGNFGMSVSFKFWPDGSPTTEDPAPPAEGQSSGGEQFTGDGSTVEYQTGFPYAPGSIHVTVGGVAVTPTETDPTTGTFTLPFAPPPGSIIVVVYQNAGTEPTGGGGSIPTAGGGLIEGIATAETDTSKRLAPDGSGGVEWIAMADGIVAWFNFMRYGAVNDGSTDDSSAIDAAIADYNAAGGGVLYAPQGAGYASPVGFTTITADGTLLGDGMGAYDGSSYASAILCSSGTAELFVVTADQFVFRNVGLFNVHSGAPSAGCGIRVDGSHIGQKVDLDSVVIAHFYVNEDRRVGSQWVNSNVWNFGAVLYGADIENTVNQDAGDWSMLGCNYYANAWNGTSAIRIRGAGGGKIVATKINETGGHHYATGIEVAIPTGVATGVLTITGCSIENVSGDAILITTAGTGSYALVAISGCQFGLYTSTTGYAVKIAAASAGGFVNGGIANVVIGDIAVRGGAGSNRAAVSLTNTDLVTLGAMSLSGTFTSRYVGSGDTNTTDLGAGSGAPTTADYLVGTSQAGLSAEIVVGTSPGGELGGTWASPTVDTTHSGSAHSDFVAKSLIDAKGDVLAGTADNAIARVAVGSDGKVLTADSTATAGVSWQTPTASGGGIGPILVADVHSTPLTFDDLLQNDEGDGLLYADA